MKRLPAVLICILLVLSMLLPVFCAAEANETTITAETDMRKHIVRYAYTDGNGVTCPGPNGYAVIECQYEGTRKYPFKIRYLDARDNRVKNPDQYSVVKLNYDAKWHITEATFYGTDGKITNTAQGYAHVYIRYEDGNFSNALFYNKRNEKLKDPDGTMLESISSWMEEDGSPRLPFDEVPLLMDWNPATGVMTPLVFVRGSGTTVWETACGSGSAAIGAMTAWRKGTGRAEIQVKQPGGTIRVCAEAENKTVTGITITGTVRIGEEKELNGH